MHHISIWVGLVHCFGGLSPPNPARGDGTVTANTRTPQQVVQNPALEMSMDQDWIGLDQD